VLGLGLTALLVAACGQQVAGTARAAGNTSVATSSSKSRPTASRPTRPSTRPSSSSASATPADRLDSLVGTWEGEYTCGQGNTGLKLTIKDREAGTVPATFEFFPLPSNPGAAKGSYAMVGAFSSTGQLVFRQQKWIEQPDGYVMVDLAVTSPVEADTRQLSGDVLADNCKGFSVRKT
jgi:hypothetical protein